MTKFKTGDRVVCINNYYAPLTKKKVYKALMVLDSGITMSGYIKVRNDDGETDYYSPDRFELENKETVSEVSETEFDVYMKMLRELRAERGSYTLTQYETLLKYVLSKIELS
jgi:hypothetical protein